MSNESGSSLQVAGAAYLAGELHPQHALPTRAMYVAVDTDTDTVVGLIAGHLTRRYDCDGELQWIDVAPDHQQQGIASALLCQLATWFASHHATRICVDVDSANTIARRFYARHGAVPLNPHWLVWPDITVVLTPATG